MELLISSSNPGKIREFRQMLAGGNSPRPDSPGQRLEWRDLAGHDVTPPRETGATFRANAMLKAAHYARALRTWALADDSGLEVDALGGKPGVTSARWAEMHGAGSGDQANNDLLLRQLSNVSDQKRTARFVCVLALADARGRIVLTAQGEVEGRILHAPRGSNGFGYDPLFLVDHLSKTTAELPPTQKHEISHRGRALRHLRSLMERYGMI